MMNSFYKKVGKFIFSIFGLNISELSNLKKVLFAVMLSIVFIAFLKSIHDQIRWNSVDFRPRVTSARAFLQNIDPYAIEWHKGMSEELLDPKEGHPPGPMRMVITPTWILFNIIPAGLPYKIQTWLWWLFSWTCMLTSIVLLSRIIKNKEKCYLFLCIALIFFSSSYFWRLHLERGQTYIFITLLLSLLLYTLINHKHKDNLIGIILGMICMLRISFFPSILFLLLFKKYRIVSSSILTVTVIFIITQVTFGSDIWLRFFDNIQRWENMLLYQDEYSKIFEHKREYPIYAEGLDLRHFLSRNSLNETFWIRFKDDLGIKYNYLYNRYFVVSIISLFSLFCIKLRNLKDKNLSWLMILTVIIFIEFFAPQRNAYNNVTLLPLIALFYTLDYRNTHLFGLLFSLAIGHTLIPVNTPLIPTWGKHIFFFITIVSLIYYELKSKKKPILSKK